MLSRNLQANFLDNGTRPPVAYFESCLYDLASRLFQPAAGHRPTDRRYSLGVNKAGNSVGNTTVDAAFLCDNKVRIYMAYLMTLPKRQKERADRITLTFPLY